MLTPEQLDMIERLQPFFRKKMGEWQEGDEFLPFIEEPENVLTTTEVYGGFPVSGIYRYPGQGMLRIPKPIDWQNPERGLWWMIQEQKKFVSLLKSEKGCACQVYKLDSPTLYSYEAPDPFTALLKALCEQEGV